MRGENAANIYAKQCEIIHNPILPMLLRITYDAQSQLHSKSCCEGYTRVEHDFRLWERFTTADTNVEGLMWKRTIPFVKLVTPRQRMTASYFQEQTFCNISLLVSFFWVHLDWKYMVQTFVLRTTIHGLKCFIKNTNHRNNSYTSGIYHSSEWISQTRHPK